MSTWYGDSPADAHSPQAVSIGHGSAMLFSNGTVLPVSWSRGAPDQPFRLVGPDGSTTPLPPGRTWVALPLPDSTTVLDQAAAARLTRQ